MEDQNPGMGTSTTDEGCGCNCANCAADKHEACETGMCKMHKEEGGSMPTPPAGGEQPQQQ